MRFEILSRSESGLHFVRETKSGIVRTLTEEELHDFEDPKPCEECGEQFGCDHYNCAGERLLDDGAPLLLLNGGLMSIGTWQPFVGALSSRHRMIRCDFRGQLLTPGLASSW